MWEARAAWEVVGTKGHFTPDTWERLVGPSGRERKPASSLPSQLYRKDRGQPWRHQHGALREDTRAVKSQFPFQFPSPPSEPYSSLPPNSQH